MKCQVGEVSSHTDAQTGCARVTFFSDFFITFYLKSLALVSTLSTSDMSQCVVSPVTGLSVKLRLSTCLRLRFYFVNCEGVRVLNSLFKNFKRTLYLKTFLRCSPCVSFVIYVMCEMFSIWIFIIFVVIQIIVYVTFRK